MSPQLEPNHTHTHTHTVQQTAPQLSPLVWWMYGQPSDLVVPNAPPGAPTIRSSSGVRQGDPCGPLLFALTIQPQLRAVQQALPNLRIIAYLDDIALQGEFDDVTEGYGLIKQRLSEVGLEIQQHKSLVYSPDFDQKDEMSFALGIPTADGGLVVAGCPVGEAEFIADSASGASQEVEKLVQTLMELDLPVQRSHP